MELLLSQPVREVQVPLRGLLTSVLVGIVVTVVSATLPAWQAGRISPLEALRVRARPHAGRQLGRLALLGAVLAGLGLYLLYFSPFNPTTQYAAGGVAVFSLFLGTALLIPVSITFWQRLAWPWVRGLYGGEGTLGMRNVERGKVRTALTVITLVVGSAMILSIRATTRAYEVDIQSWIDRYVGGDLYVHATLPMRADLRYRLEAVDGVAVVTPLHYFWVEWRKPEGGSERLTYLAIEPATYRQVTSVVLTGGQGDADALLDQLDRGDSVFVSTVLAEKQGIKNGDTLRLETRRGPKDFRVVATVVNFQSGGLVVQGSWQDMRRYFGVDEVSAFLIRVQPDQDPEQVRERIRSQYGERRHLTVDSNRALKRQAFSITSQAFSMFNVLVYIAMVVATLGVVNTLTVSVLERTQEIGMLRSLGMTRRQIGKMILAEAGMMGFVGGVLGLIFGLLLSRLFIQGASAVRGYALNYVLPLDGVLACVLIAFVFSQLAALWPARHAARVRIMEAIQCE
jgi:putative ABC transport system permease protein